MDCRNSLLAVKILHKPAQIIENQADNFLMLPQKTVRIFDNTHVRRNSIQKLNYISMTTKKVDYIFAIKLLFGLFILTLLFISCSENKAKQPNDSIPKYDGVTIDVDISNVNCLAILLAKDGTINRKGSGVLDTLDKNFFMGLAKDNPFDSLMNGIPNDLLTYCNEPSLKCDTLKQTFKVKIAFGNNDSVCEIEYCVNGAINDLPKPIKDFLEKAILVTDPWYQSQKKLLLPK